MILAMSDKIIFSNDISAKIDKKTSSALLPRRFDSSLSIVEMQNFYRLCFLIWVLSAVEMQIGHSVRQVLDKACLVSTLLPLQIDVLR